MAKPSSTEKTKHADTLGEPVVTSADAPRLLVEFNDDVHGIVNGEEIKPGKTYPMHMAEATLVVMEKKGKIVGTEEQ
jgi:hypothetical protein